MVQYHGACLFVLHSAMPDLYATIAAAPLGSVATRSVLPSVPGRNNLSAAGNHHILPHADDGDMSGVEDSHAAQSALPAELVHDPPRYLRPLGSTQRLTIARFVAQCGGGAAVAADVQKCYQNLCPGMLLELAPRSSVADVFENFTSALVDAVRQRSLEVTGTAPSIAGAAALAALQLIATRLGCKASWSAKEAYSKTCLPDSANRKSKPDVNVNHLVALFVLYGIGEAHTLKLYAVRDKPDDDAASMTATFCNANGGNPIPVSLELLAAVTCDWDGHPGESPVCGSCLRQRLSLSSS